MRNIILSSILLIVIVIIGQVITVNKIDPLPLTKSTSVL